MRAKLLGAVLAAFLAPLAMMVSIEAGELPGKGKIAAPAQAIAQDQPPVWTGFYAGASVGYGFTRTEYDSVADGTGTLSKENVLGTAGIGWDLQMSNMVVGIMADITARDVSDPSYQWFIGARGGVLITPRTLVYALAGYTEELDGTLAFKSADTTKLQDLAGLTLGGGLEHMLAPGWTAKAEYRYVSFGREHAPDGAIDGLVDGSKIDSGEHQVRLGVNRRF
jgi:outer membrane immunogenic protein